MHIIPATCLQLNQFYKTNDNKARAKPDDLMFAAMSETDTLSAVLRLLPYSNFLFLRSVLTREDLRGNGIAAQLIDQAINEIASKGLPYKCIYTLPTPQAKSLYLRLGFRSITSEQIPSELSASYRRFRRSNSDSTVMVLAL